jgi:hypothetical protein
MLVNKDLKKGLTAIKLKDFCNISRYVTSFTLVAGYSSTKVQAVTFQKAATLTLATTSLSLSLSLHWLYGPCSTGLLQYQFPGVSILSHFSSASNTHLLQIVFNVT